VSNINGLKTDNILGYRIIEKIGAGGFGEVYRAEAPGGLMKAVKILFGCHDERRAKDELKALDRIKELRHPFLLSLERIEVVGQQLIVITELADRSLGDLFDSYAAAGQSGIPREELLHYLQQAADALDYLANEHRLQHLDVKPENLLLVGKHLKLADFGLVKDLKDASQSLMGGLTPAFSSPELFDGRPSMKSDQYALAIVYQEMLTGVRPFTGSTLAQLASQHIHSQPDLTPLPRNDRATIARALSKKPEQRFPLCRVMIDELVNQRLIVRNNKRTRIPGRLAVDTVAKDFIPRTGDISDNNSKEKTAELPSPKSEVRLVEGPEPDGTPRGIGPVLLVGVGRTAIRILQRLKHNVKSRIGNLAQMPAIRILCVDTERFAGDDPDRPEESCPLDANEQVLLPLRRSDEYRSRSNVYKNWLNRRWIYNVPKTLQTEGLRPLGRLAFVDNFPALCEGLESAIEKISSVESLVATAERMGVEPAPDRPKVFILSSISGGLGSGMSIDLACTIRLILDEHSLCSDCVHGLFLHATSSQKGDVGISIANTFAFLTELRHVTQEGYPGEEACGIPVIDDEAPVDYPYFLHLGDNADKKSWDQSLDSISEYLYHNIFSPSADFFDNCRKLESEIDHFAFRSFGVQSVGTGENHCQRQLSGYLAESLLARWAEADLQLSCPEAVVALETGISPNTLARVVRDIVSKTVPKDATVPVAEKLVRWVMDRSLPDHHGPEILEQFDSMLGKPPGDGKASAMDMNGDFVGRLVNHSKLLGQLIDRAVTDCFRQERLSFQFVLEMIRRMTASVEHNRATLSLEITALKEDNAELHAILQAVRRRTKDSNSDRTVAESAAARLHANRHDAILKWGICDLLLGVVRRLNSMKTDVGHMKEEVTSAVHCGDAELNQRALLARFGGLQQKLAASILGDSEKILDNIERRLYLEQVQPSGDFWTFLNNAGFVRRYLPEAIGEAVRSELAAAGRSTDIDRVFADYLDSARSSASDEIMQMVSRSMPMLAGCGGPTRVMVGIPQHVQSTRMAEEVFSHAGIAGQVVPSTSGDLVIATETEDVSLAEIAFKMLATRSDCVELARRLESRTDVAWKSLEDLL